MTHEEHRLRHVRLHKALDELLADWIGHTSKLPHNIPAFELMEWSYAQTIDPIETDRLCTALHPLETVA